MERRSGSCIGKLRLVQLLVLFKSLDRFNEIHIKIPTGFLILHMILKFTLKSKEMRIVNFEKEIT